MTQEDHTLTFSVVIPTRDRLGLLGDALKGLQQQSFDHKKFEVIIIDNGSSDGTITAIQQQTNEFSFPLRIEANPDCERGPAPARNMGVNIAKGEIIAFLDSDCRPHENWLFEANQVFTRTPELAIATGVIDFKPEQRANLTFFARKTVVALTEHPTYPTANSFYKRHIFLTHDGFNSDLSFPNIMGQSVEAADTDLAWRVKNANGLYEFMPSAIVYHEVQVLPPKEWLLEPLRLFLLPALVNKHPRLRSELLMWGFVFYPRSIIYYLLAILLISIAIVAPNILFYLPLVLVLASIAKTQSLKPERIWLGIKQIILNTIRNYVMCGALIYGSAKYKTLVI